MASSDFVRVLAQHCSLGVSIQTLDSGLVARERERDDDYQSISVEEIIELARTYFTKDNQMKVDIIPVTTDAE